MRFPARLLSGSDTLSAAALLAEVLFPRSRVAARMSEIDRLEVEAVNADLYLPAGKPSPGIVLALGALREGRRYPILESTARAIASCGFAVLVPELGRLRDLILGVDALDDLVDAARTLHDRPGVVSAPVGLIGFSLGGSLALLAAADPRLRDRVACVAAMGSYFRLTDMLDAAVGGFKGPGDEPITLAAPSAYAVAASLVDRLSGPDRQRLGQIIDRDRGSPLEALSRVEPTSLGPEGRLVLDLLTNPDRGARAALIENVEGLAHVMAVLSPEGVIGRIEAPVWVLHDERDRYVPFGQFRVMREAAQGRSNFRFFDIRLLEHTEPVPPALNPRALFGDYLPGLGRLFMFAHGPVAAVRRTAKRP
jgi:pimeloyl-ACP methyl ester carboxylesterase